MENVDDRNLFILGISKRIAQKSGNHKPTLGILSATLILAPFCNGLLHFMSKIYT
jgi:hypothetical protein